MNPSACKIEMRIWPGSTPRTLNSEKKEPAHGQIAEVLIESAECG